MAGVTVWYANNDMYVRLATLQSATAASTAYINSSTGVTVAVYPSTSTGTATIASKNMGYTTATTFGANGTYQAIIGSTQSTALTVGSYYTAIVTVSHSGANGEWRMPFKHITRGAT